MDSDRLREVIIRKRRRKYKIPHEQFGFWIQIRTDYHLRIIFERLTRLFTYFTFVVTRRYKKSSSVIREL